MQSNAKRRAYTALMRLAVACRNCSTDDQRANLLAIVGDGTRRLGPKVSATVFRVFSGGDRNEDVTGSWPNTRSQSLLTVTCLI